MALSQAEKQEAGFVGSHDTVEAVGANEWTCAATIRVEVHPDKEDVAEFDVELKANADETEERSIYSPVRPSAILH